MSGFLGGLLTGREKGHRHADAPPDAPVVALRHADVGYGDRAVLKGALAATLLLGWVSRSRFGHGLRSLRENEEAAETLGVPIVRLKLLAYVLSAVIPGMVGGVMATRSTYFVVGQVFDPMISITVIAMAIIGGGDDEDEEPRHFQNFIECVRSRQAAKLTAPLEEGHLSTTLCHLGNISYRLGRSVKFDGATERFVGDEEADLLEAGARVQQQPDALARGELAVGVLLVDAPGAAALPKLRFELGQLGGEAAGAGLGLFGRFGGRGAH